MVASAMSATPALPGGKVPPVSIGAEACVGRIAAFVRRYAPQHPRFVFTFTGSQTALLPLWEAAGGPHSENAFFPIDRDTFVLTMTYRATNPQVGMAEWFGTTLCALGEGKGARYNGALAYSGNDMIGADMSDPPKARR